jgi:hypothetical protein
VKFHVLVKSRGNGPGANGVGVARAPADLHGVRCRVGEENGDQGVGRPPAGAGGENGEGDDAGEEPDLDADAKKGAVVDSLSWGS